MAFRIQNGSRLRGGKSGPAEFEALGDSHPILTQRGLQAVVLDRSEKRNLNLKKCSIGDGRGMLRITSGGLV